VNCAGIPHRGRVVGREGPMAQADFARVVTANLIGTFLVCRAAATVMQHNLPEPDGDGPRKSGKGDGFIFARCSRDELTVTLLTYHVRLEASSVAIAAIPPRHLDKSLSQ
jgi:NAD(P)-dependent dehydrogenase (short-subunit alcohol dehydrogenase family)